ncbi:Cytochrome p450 monooxygenase [Lasiodiplodia theobromae]|uniref:Cytochrome p450 monooxygenase n=1 Tax=Lasiodiplodia theobromae TaxID=45133 RepID=UPI0015C3E1BE|nr:Cytochrome p450 monooxygenase [Lasiodiplodia theobromae]KAF4546137.1 Cytochrome p450 monooxygenase [Lasiodiplodia theobromae]
MLSILSLLLIPVAIALRRLWIKWQEDRAYASLNVPVIKGSETTDYKALIRSQYVNDPEQVFILQTPFRRVIVLPDRLVNEYTWLPEASVTSAGDLCERFLGDYTCVGSMYPDTPGDRSHTAIGYAKQQLTKNASFIMPTAHDEIEASIAEIFGECSDWTGFPLHQAMCKIMLRVYQTVFVGGELARNETWMKYCTEHSAAAMRAAVALSKWDPILRPVAALFIPEMRDLRRRFNILRDFVAPIHKARFTEMQKPGFKNPHDLVQHFIENAGKDKHNTSKLIEGFVILNFAGVVSTGTVLTQALFDLAAHPEYIEPLREESRSLVASEGTIRLRPASLAKLQNMDSFFKESQRFNHANLLSVYRKIIKPLPLTNGMTLPANSYVAVSNAYAVISGEKKQPHEFNGFQWAEKRAIAGNESKYTYVSVGPESVEFGAGRNACPGRFFATNVLKATLSRLLLEYDFKLPDGKDRPVNNFNHLFSLIYDTTATLEFRKKGKQG